MQKFPLPQASFVVGNQLDVLQGHRKGLHRIQTFVQRLDVISLDVISLDVFSLDVFSLDVFSLDVFSLASGFAISYSTIGCWITTKVIVLFALI